MNDELRAAVARLEGENAALRSRLQSEGEDAEESLAELTAERDAARAALVEETARRLWAEYAHALDAAGLYGAAHPRATWAAVTPEMQAMWRDAARRAVARARAASEGGAA